MRSSETHFCHVLKRKFRSSLSAVIFPAKLKTAEVLSVANLSKNSTKITIGTTVFYASRVTRHSSCKYSQKLLLSGSVSRTILDGQPASYTIEANVLPGDRLAFESLILQYSSRKMTLLIGTSGVTDMLATKMTLTFSDQSFIGKFVMHIERI